MNNTNISIRAARSEDLHTVEALLEAAKLPLDGVRDFFPTHYAVAERDDQLIGAIGIEEYGEYGLLRSAVITETARGTGIGRELVHAILQWGRGQKFHEVYLLTTTAPVFFEKLGFKTIDRDSVPAVVQQAPEFVSICPSTAVVMRLRL